MVSIMDKANSLTLITKLVRRVFPLVDSELAHWRNYIDNNVLSQPLSQHAVNSIYHKKFHCQGGSFFSLYPQVNTQSFVKLVVALQTISDYLDNLCDRGGVSDQQSFAQLHLALTDALDPDRPLHDYYLYYPAKNDGGYLNALVNTCRQQVRHLPSYHKVKPLALNLAGQYGELQTFKHLDASLREQITAAWATKLAEAYPELSPWEYAASAGSTLGLFILCAIAADPRLTDETVKRTHAAFFPWICGLHILLDYFIDLEEDKANNDLNFISYYKNEAEILSRLSYFSQQSFFCARDLPEPLFAVTIVHGLLALYLSDPKVLNDQDRSIKTNLLNTSGTYTKFVYGLCRILRKQNLL